MASKLPNPHCRAMRKNDSSEGRTIYAHRMGLIEPVFGHTQQRGLRRFTLRGQSDRRRTQCQTKKETELPNATRVLR